MTELDNFFSVSSGGLLLLRALGGATVLLLLAGASVLLLSSESASLRHRVWGLSMAAILVLPLPLTLLPDYGPQWHMRAFVPDRSISTVDSAVAVAARGTREVRASRPTTIGQERSGPIAPTQHGLRVAKDQLKVAAEAELAHKRQMSGQQDTMSTPVGSARHGAVTRIDSLSLEAGFVWVWLSGVVIGLFLFVRSCLSAAGIARRAIAITHFETLALNEQLRSSAGVRVVVPLLCSSEVATPVTIGWLHSVIVLPTGYGQWTVTRCRAVLAHELAHIRRRDVLLQLIARMACVVYWYHPFVWFANWRMRVEREYACDDAVLASGERPDAYATCLLDVAAELVGIRRGAPPTAVAMASRRKVEQRVRYVLAPNRRRHPVSRSVGLVLTAIVSCVVIATGVLSPSVVNVDSAAAAVSRDVAKSSTNNGQTETSDEGKEPEDGINVVNVRGRVVDPNAAPVRAARVLVHTYPGPLEVTADELGRFELQQRPKELRGRSVLAYSTDGEQIGRYELPYEVEELQALDPLRIELKPTVAVRIRVTDKDGAPVASAKSGVLADYEWYGHGTTDQHGLATFRIPADATLHNVYAVKSGLGVDYREFFDPVKQRNNEPQTPPNLDEPINLVLEGSKTVRVRVVDEVGSDPISGARVYLWLTKKPSEPNRLNLSYLTNQLAEYTDGDGEAVFDWIPIWEERKGLTFWPSHDDYARLRGIYDIASGDGTLTIHLPRLVSLGGQVRHPDGRPAAGVAVRVVGEGHTFDSFREEILTDEEGRYRVKAVPNMIYMVVALNSMWSATRDGFALWPGKPLEDVDLVLQPTTRIHGRVTLGDDYHPVKGFRIQSYQFGMHLRELEDIQLPNPENSRTVVQPMTFHDDITDAQGNFEFFVGPGSYDIRGPTQTEVQKFEVTKQEEMEFNFHSERPEKGPLEGLVVNAETGDPVAGAEVSGIYRHGLAGRDLKTQTDSDGEFHVTRELHRTVLHARSRDGKRQGVVEIGPDEQRVTIRMKPVARAFGRLVDADSEQPLASKQLRFGVDVPIGDDDAPWRTAFGGSVVTDGQGRFILEGLVPGQEYGIDVVLDDGHGYREVAELTPEPAARFDLGDVELSRPEPPYEPPTLQERVASAFTFESIDERIADGKRDAQSGHLRLLFVFADAASEATEELYKLRYEDDDIRSILNDYWVLSIPATRKHRAEAARVAGELGVDLSSQELPVVVIATDEGESVVQLTGSQLERNTLLQALRREALPPLDAKQLVDEALARAKAENKRVFIQETATWCAPCWELKRFINDRLPVFEKDYVFVALDQRWKKSQEVMASLRPDERARGIPWSVILDGDGNVLATSDGPNGNIGFPSSETGIDHFMSMLTSTSIRLSETELARVREDLEPD